jgi:hypothetical protein
MTLVVDNDLSLVYLGGTTGDFTMPYYPTDTADFPRPETKTLRDVLAAQFDMLRPDTSCPSIGDYGFPTPPMADHWSTELSWDLFGDERAAGLLSRGSRRADGASICGEDMLTLLFGRALPEAPRFESRSVIYPHAGYAVLKSVEGEGYWQSDAIVANLFFGPFGNGHGHADKLALEISGAGRKCCIEELYRSGAEWRYWNSTVSHNAVAVGGKSQPGNADQFTTGIDSCGRLVFHRFTPEVKAACAEAPEVYAGMRTYRRTVAVTDAYVVDVFEVAAEAPTVFDWFLHGMDGVTLEGVTLAESQIGNSAEGYEYLNDVRSGRPAGAVTVRFGMGHAVFVPEAAGFEVFTADGPWKEDAKRPAVILRKRGESAVFVVVHDPSGRAVERVEIERGGSGFSLAVELAAGRRDRVEFAAVPGERGAGDAPHDVLYDKGKGGSAAID